MKSILCSIVRFKILTVGIITIIILLILGYFYYTFPQKTNLSYNGIKYKLGDMQQEEEIKITMNGYYYKRVFTKDFFKGSINIENKNYPSLKLLVDEQLQMVSYRNNEENGKLYTFGEIFIEENLTNLTVCVQDKQNGWNSKDGFMISAPAENRFEALNISNKLMKNILIHKLK